jgi:uncharacterized repeat protein (TIGR01451 family)
VANFTAVIGVLKMHKSLLLKRLTLSLGLCLSIHSAYAATTGKAFSDFDGDGIQDSGEVGRAGIIVKAFKTGTTTEVATATTDATGSYSLSVPATDYPVRLEYSLPTDTCGIDPALDFPSANGDKYGTSVQFAQADGEVHNFIFNYPADFSTDDNPRVFLPKMINGDPLAGGNAGDAPAIVSFHYQDNGVAANSERGGGTAPAYDIAAIQKQVGSVYGVAYSRQAKKLFAAAFMKRHSGFGPLGGGGIYMLGTEPPFNTTANLSFVDLDAIGIATSDEAGAYAPVVNGTTSVEYSPVIGTNTQRGLPASRANPSNDPLAHSQIGRLSIGDIDISEDGRYLYAVNLYDRKLYELDLTDPLNPTAPTNAKTKGFSIPHECTAAGGEHRPFALKIARGKAYVGVTCSGESADGTATGTTADMKGSIYALDLKTQTWSTSPLISFSFDYRSSPVWYRWSSSTWQDPYEVGQPLISDIEFDNGGNFIIGVMDVRGHRHGHNNYRLSGTGTHSAATTGETLSAKRDTSVKTCKYDIQTSPEFYNDHLHHTESSQGALAVHHTAASDQVMSTFMDPIGIYSAGVHLYNNQNGQRVNQGYEVFYSAAATDPGPANFGKAGGLGDLETVEVVPSVEIGNRVWLDLNSDGIQDGNEAGIENVDVTLKCPGGEKTIATNNLGEYYFTNVAGGNATFMDSTESCTVSVNSQQPALVNRGLTTPDADGKTDNALQTDIRDSDGKPNATNTKIAEVTFTVGNPGENNHSLDFGYTVLKADLHLSKTASTLKPRVGQPFTYTITITNDGPTDATGIKVMEKLPTTLTYLSHTGGTYDKDTGIWDVGALSVGAANAKKLEITVKAN